MSADAIGIALIISLAIYLAFHAARAEYRDATKRAENQRAVMIARLDRMLDKQDVHHSHLRNIHDAVRGKPEKPSWFDETYVVDD